VLSTAEEHIGFFSHKALARRKTAAGPRPWWLDNYIRAAWAGDRQTMAGLKQSLEPHIKLYREVYEPLRHSYFAHRAIKPRQSIRHMFQQTNREEIGETIRYLRDVAEALRQAFVNGTNPIPIKAAGELDREEVRSAVRSVLVKLAQWPLSRT